MKQGDVLGMKAMAKKLFVGAIYLLVVASLALAGEACNRCHGLPGISTPEGKSVYVDSATFAESAHGGLGCSACHTGDWTYPHQEKSAPVACGQCHEGEKRDYDLGAHGRAAAQGSPDVPGCADCHGVHDVVPIALLTERRTAMENLLLNKCVECHTNQDLMRKYGVPLDRFATYETTAHGRADRFGSVAVARCATCHGSHAILPPDDPRSPVNPQNLASTCGKCHENAQRFVGRSYHVVSEAMPRPESYNAVLRSFYWILLVFGGVATVFFAIVAFRGE